MPVHLSWADAAEIAFGLTPEVWHTAVEVFEIILLNKVKEPSQARGRTIESIRNRLITHSKKDNGRFLWDQVNHKFALRTKVKHVQKKKHKRSVSSDKKSSKSSKRPKVDLMLTNADTPLSSSTSKLSLLSPSGGCRTPTPFEGVIRHEECDRHDNMVYYKPLPLDTVMDDFHNGSCTVEVEGVGEAVGWETSSTAVNVPDSLQRHCIAPHPHKGINCQRKYFQNLEEFPSRTPLKFPPIQFNSDFFPEIAFHYFSVVDQCTSNNMGVYCHINAKELSEEAQRSFTAWIPPEGTRPPNFSSDSEESDTDSDSTSSDTSAFSGGKTKSLLTKRKVLSPKATLKKDTILSRPEVQKPTKTLPPQHPTVKKPNLKKPSVTNQKVFPKKSFNSANNAGGLGKSRKPVHMRKSTSNHKASAALSQRDVQHLLTTADSSLARINLRGLLTIDNFNKFPQDQRKTVAQFLPSMDQEGDRAGGVTAKSTAFSNVFFAASLREWQRSLSNSEFTVEYQTKVRAEERKRMIEAASQVNVKTPRLMFPSDPCHVPKPREIPLASPEGHALNIINSCLNRLEEKDKPKVDTPTSTTLRGLECTESLGGRSVSRSTATTHRKPRRHSRNEIEPKIPSRGRPKKQHDTPPPPPPNGIVQRGVGGVNKTNTQIKPSAVTEAWLPGRGGGSNMKVPSSDLPREFLSYVPPQVRYKEVLVALEKAHKENVAASKKKTPERRRTSSEPPKRLLARHMKHRKISVYHDHFAILSPTLQPEDFRIETSHLESKLTLQSYSHSMQSEGANCEQTQLDCSSAHQEVNKLCMCSLEPFHMCKDCKYVYHSSCSTNCLVCGSKLCF